MENKQNDNNVEIYSKSKFKANKFYIKTFRLYHNYCILTFPALTASSW